ncbi:MAG: histidine kinase [Oscillospiraceae bacterium]|jgi:iron only hydrogenase large subunit-like protein/uncharacterized Fe-S cluster-containing protein|nr:histidine kinase [Oscillospiraceae bacterium]
MSTCLQLKKSNCKNCYKCIRNCPVKSIRFSGNQAHIVDDECILCGGCFVVCPQNAKEIVDETEKAKVLIQSGAPVVASIAPSFIANYDGVGIQSMREALKKLGFYDAEETAVGATIVKKLYEDMLLGGNRDVLVSSCCHSINLLIQKHFPRALPYLADVVSPMQAHALDIKRRYPGAKTVFVGPCVAKKDEAAYYGDIVDAVLTFEELSRWLAAKGVKPRRAIDNEKKSKARLFPTAGGILKTMNRTAPGYTYLAIDGVENCMNALRDIEEGRLHKCFIEMSACVGSCIGGPAMENRRRFPISDYIAVSSYAGAEDFDASDLPEGRREKALPYIARDSRIPSEKEVIEILKRMGKTALKDELNCGSCGYNTCREKAIAVYQGKADFSMCLPFLKDKAESFSDNIINNTPNGILVLNENLEVQQINRAALRLMNIRFESNVLGAPVVRILDPDVFIKVRSNGRGVHDQRAYLAEYDKYVDQTILYEKEYNIIICIMRDVTNEENERERKEEFARQTVETADKVVEKQMRVVQEIASLLGETVAETKIALTKLKGTILDE